MKTGSYKTSRMSFFRKAYCAMCSINTMLLIISIASPFWLVHHCVPGDIHVGLWMVCFQKECIRNPVLIESVTVTQGLMITALGCSVIALLASQDLFTRVLKREVPEVLISSLANYSAGLCTICSLMIMLFELQVVVKTENSHLAPDWAFWISCVSFLLSLVLGTRSLLFHQYSLTEEKMLASQVNPLQGPQPLFLNNMNTPV
ncbi:uncharacterized protein LOC121915990 [Sceloporus undulatus]|uniref:uncharacterized protein LOC121915990 n=1 Tax=Sceloporus undulatus TaxID=8520 RepID=UPI001C4D770F|nr:uncharacterized protein LOC121915990 [Sceloporus undulatus]